MADSSGGSRATGAVLSDWDHVVQSIETILTTPVGSRVMRRDFGSHLLDLVDRPMTDGVILLCYGSIQQALSLWEPRFRATLCSVAEVNADGRLALRLGGIYIPRGHRGDFTEAYDGRAIITIGNFLGFGGARSTVEVRPSA